MKWHCQHCGKIKGNGHPCCQPAADELDSQHDRAMQQDDIESIQRFEQPRTYRRRLAEGFFLIGLNAIA